MQYGILTLADLLPGPETGRRMEPFERLQQLIDMAEVAESLGFHAFHVGEHHFCDFVVSAPAVVLATVAARTKRLRVGTGVALLANNDPVRVAEDYATLDLLSEGRVDLVVGRGLFRRTYLHFGQDPDRSREIFDEALELLAELWTGQPVRWEGSFRPALDGVTLTPAPPARDVPPIWVAGGTSFASVDAAARYGFGLILPTLVPAPTEFRLFAERYRQQVAAADHPAGARRLGACSHVHVAPTSQLARRRWQPYHMNYFTWLMGTVMPWAGANIGRGHHHKERHARRHLTVPSYDSLLAGPSICGSPDEVVDRLAGMAELLTLDRHLLMVDHGGIPPELATETLELLASEVLPQLSGPVPQVAR